MRPRPDARPFLESLKDFQRATVEFAFRRLSAVIPDYDPNTTPLERATLLPLYLADFTQSRVNLVSLTPGTSFSPHSNPLGRWEERMLIYVLLDELWGVPGTGPLNLLQGYVRNRDSFRAEAAKWRERIRDGVNGRPYIHTGIKQAFFDAVQEHVQRQRRAGEPDLHTRFVDLCHRFRYFRRVPPEHDRRDRDALIGELRTILARTCLRFLEPDLIILDEFQRFKSLLTDDNEAGKLAQELFRYAGDASAARVLLLSATPYKMYTLHHEQGEDHYRDFIETVRFLYGDEEETKHLTHVLDRYRRAIFRLAGDTDATLAELKGLRDDIQRRLARVMVRTERLTAPDEADSMVREVTTDDLDLRTDDVRCYLALQRVARALDQGDMMPFWKSAPYALSFMDDYRVKHRLREALEEGPTADLLSALREGLRRGIDIPWAQWRRYAEIDPHNARLRRLLATTVEEGMWRLLWLPPSQPYYEPDGLFKDGAGKSFTKRLVFSAWRVVPKVIAAVLSYAAERHMMHSLEKNPRNTPSARRQKRPLLRFGFSENRLTGMPVMALMYPSMTLARIGDPLTLSGEAVREGSLPTRKQLAAAVRQALKPLLAALPPGKRQAGPDEGWYWAAPLLLDFHFDPVTTYRWLSREDAAGAWSGGRDGREGEAGVYWRQHVARALELLDGGVTLGSRPRDLLDVLTEMALGGPAVVALRSLARIADMTDVLARRPDAPMGDGVQPPVHPDDREDALNFLRDHAGHVAFGLRSLFNTPEATALIRGHYGDAPYWRQVLQYSVDGCLQAVMDEYAHVLRDSLGVSDKDPRERISRLSQTMAETVALRTVSMRAHEFRWKAKEAAFKVVDHGVRGHFALRFGDDPSDDGDRMRSTLVRDAFNSPFWPFVLATTSVGQEGLDFHFYCHAVVHWDLPANPVDLEQREGRIHRYKGHAIRKNVALAYGKEALSAAAESAAALDNPSDPASPAHGTIAPDVWSTIFELADRNRRDANQLVPYWIFPLKGGARVERHVPALQLSRDTERLAALKRALTVYRLVFGQPHQEDLVAFLLEHVSRHKLPRVLSELTLDLRPPSGEESRRRTSFIPVP